MACVWLSIVVGGASIDSLSSAMIISMPAARVLVCLLRKSSASASIPGFLITFAKWADSGISQAATIDASEK